MTRGVVSTTAWVTVMLAGLLGRVWGAQAATPSRRHAEHLYREGRFDAADTLAASLLARGTDPLLLRLRGAVALWRSDLPAAEALLRRALDARARDREAAALLGEALYRRRQFTEAARWLDMAGQGPRALALASFNATTPFRVEGAPRALRLLQVDPLPLIEARLNESVSVVLLIDTGGGDLVVDTAVADRLALVRYGSDRGTFGGGRRAAVGYSRLATVDLGGLVVRDVPAIVMPTASLLTAPEGRPLGGIVGTSMLRQFFTTLDYASGTLTLAPPSAAPQADSSGTCPDVPIWLTHSHYIVASASFNELLPRLFVIDTGVGGAAVAPSRDVLRASRARVEQIQEAVAGGGRMRVRRLSVRRFAFGPLVREHLEGLADVFPEALDRSLGFRVSGLVGHQFFQGQRLTLDFVRMRMRVCGAPR